MLPILLGALIYQGPAKQAWAAAGDNLDGTML